MYFQPGDDHERWRVGLRRERNLLCPHAPCWTWVPASDEYVVQVQNADDERPTIAIDGDRFEPYEGRAARVVVWRHRSYGLMAGLLAGGVSAFGVGIAFFVANANHDTSRDGSGATLAPVLGTVFAGTGFALVVAGLAVGRRTSDSYSILDVSHSYVPSSMR